MASRSGGRWPTARRFVRRSKTCSTSACPPGRMSMPLSHASSLDLLRSLMLEWLSIRGVLMHKGIGAGAFVLLAMLSVVGLPQLSDRVSAQTAAAKQIPRMPDGKPSLQGIWQVRNRAAYNLEDHHARYRMPASRSVVEGGTIPYQEWALKKRDEKDRKSTRLNSSHLVIS